MTRTLLVRRGAMLGVVVTGVVAAGLAVAAPAGAAGATLVVGGPKCAGATYTTIGAAVAAASAGDTIQVCAGVYPETVTVDKSLTFLGAQAGKDGRGHKRSKLKTESVVADSGGDFVIAAGVSGVRIDGFTLEKAGSSGGVADAVQAFAGGSGFTIENNVIRDNELGINLQNPDSTMPTEISHNAFINNSLGSDGNGGSGVFISNGPADATTIEDNSFTGHRETAINTAGDSSNPSRGLVIADNSSSNDSTFLVATNTVDALVDGNTISASSGFENGSGILDFGSNQSLRISSNTLHGGSYTNTSGIRIAAATGTASSGTTVVNNTVSGRYNGIKANGGYTDLLVSGNQVSGSGNDGIVILDGSGNVFSRNKVSNSATHDCEDDTTGSLTAGTADTWRGDTGGSGSSTPAGICS